MRIADGVFTPRERKTALWALLMAGLIALMGLVIQEWAPPSVGPGGLDAYVTAPVPGVLDAQPMVDISSLQG
jgi:hypothetical protein